VSVMFNVQLKCFVNSGQQWYKQKLNIVLFFM